jgi:hypothetical protein
MRSLLARQLRTASGVILAVGILTLPQASWAQVHQASGHSVGIRLHAFSGGNGFAAALLGDWRLQSLRMLLGMQDASALSEAVNAPPAIKPRRVEDVGQLPVEWGRVNLR